MESKGIKKVLIVNWQDLKNPLSGGAEVHLHEVAQRWVQVGIKVTLFVHRYSGAAAREEVQGVEIYRMGSRNFFNFIVWFKVNQWVKEHQPDVVIDDTNKIPFFLPWLCKKVPVVVRIHHLFGQTIFKEVNFIQASYVYFLERLAAFAWKKVPVITVSQSTADELGERGVTHTTICHNGVDLKLYQPERVKKEEHLLVYLGRVKKYKNIDLLIEVVERLKVKAPHTSLLIAGGGDDIPRLKQLSKEKGLEKNVQFLGYITEEEKVNLYRRATVVVNPSFKEGWGLTNIEANACGTVVVAHDVPGLRDSVRHKETGFLVGYKSLSEFVERISWLFENDKERQEMEKKAIEWAQTFTWDACSKKTLNVLEKAVKK